MRLILAWWLPLGIDESYAIAVAREFSWAFFDHPPLGFWMPVAAANLTGIEHPLVYRVPFVICGTVTAWAIWRLGCVLGGAKAGLWALGLWTMAPYMLIGGALFVVPDGPLNMGLALSALAITYALDTDRLRDWVWVGVWLAVAMASKYQAALFPVAVLAFLMLTPLQWRRMLRLGPWLGAGIGLLGLIPVIAWNVQHDWASFAFHTARVGPQFQPDNFGAMTAGQILYLLPPTFVLGLLGLSTAMRKGATLPARMLGWTGGLTVAVFMGTFLYGNATFPHWTMPGWLLLIPLAGAWVAEHGRHWTRRMITGFAAPIWALIALLAVHVQTGLLTRGSDPIPDWDNTAEMSDLSKLPMVDQTMGWTEDITKIAALDWIEAGQIGTAFQGTYPVAVLGPNPHHFQFMTATTVQGPTLVLVIGRGRRMADQLAQAQAMPDAQPLGQIQLMRGGRPYITVHGFRINDPVN